MHPAPTRKIPVLIGGGGERKTLRLVAKHADIWHTYTVGDELQRKLDVLAGHCVAVDRPFDEIEISGTSRPADPRTVSRERCVLVLSSSERSGSRWCTLRSTGRTTTSRRSST